MIGPISSCISTPFEFVKTQMQIQNLHSSTGPKSSIECALNVVKNFGIRRMFTAHGVNTLRECVFLGTYFTVYEHSKAQVNKLFSASIAVPISGGISGAIGWFLSFPLDCIKSNIQGRSLNAIVETPVYAREVFFQLLRTKGISGLYSGIVPSIARAFLVSSTRFSAYETTIWCLQRE